MDLSKEIHDDESRWSEVMDWPLMVAAAIFLIAYAVPILYEDASPTLHFWCEVVQWVTWSLFALDYVMRLRAARDRRRWFVRHLLDLAIIVLPMFRQLRLLRLVAVLSTINRHAAVELRGRVTSYLIGGAVLFSFVAALAVLDAERHHPEANIVDFDDAWWWALTTMTTVGYGDRFPVTGTGRMVAAGLMIGGIGLLGTVTAMLASWFAQLAASDDQHRDRVLLDELRTLQAEVADLRIGLSEAGRTDTTRVAQRHPSPEASPPAPGSP